MNTASVIMQVYRFPQNLTKKKQLASPESPSANILLRLTCLTQRHITLTPLPYAVHVVLLPDLQLFQQCALGSAHGRQIIRSSTFPDFLNCLPCTAITEALSSLWEAVEGSRSEGSTTEWVQAGTPSKGLLVTVLAGNCTSCSPPRLRIPLPLHISSC